MKTLSIYGIPFKVTYNFKDPSAIGQTSLRPATIELDGNLQKDQLDLTLIHEYCHALVAMSGLSIDDAKVEELFVSAISNELYRAGFRPKLKGN